MGNLTPNRSEEETARKLPITRGVKQSRKEFSVNFLDKMADAIKFHSTFNLTDIGICKKTIASGNITISSGKFIVCAEKFGKSVQTTFLEIADPFNKQRRCPLEAILHPSGSFIACKTGKYDIHLSIIDTKTTENVKQGKIDEKMLFWKWIDDKFIGIVTENNVYRWAMEGDSEPIKVFECLPILSECKIVNYRENDAICVLAVECATDQFSGLIQVYNKRTGNSNWIEAEAFAFVKFKLASNPHPSDILIYSHKEEGSAKLVLKEINECAFENHQYPEQNFYLPTMPDADVDFPIAIKASAKLGVLYIITKKGYLQLFDLHSNTIFFAMRISQRSIITAAGISPRSMVFVDAKGQVTSFSVEKHLLIAYIVQWNPDLASNLARRWIKSDESRDRSAPEAPDRSDPDHFYDSPPSETDSPPRSPSNFHEFRPIPLPRTSSIVSRPLPVLPNEGSDEDVKSRLEELCIERDEIADRYKELERRYRRVLIMMGIGVERDANQPINENE